VYKRPGLVAAFLIGACTGGGGQAAASPDRHAASSTVGRMKATWDAFGAGEVPRLIRPMMTHALRALDRAVRARDTARARQAAIDIAQSTLDLELRHRPASEVNLARFDLWTAQLLVDAATRDAAAVRGDVFTLGYIRDRILHALSPADLTAMNIQLGRLQIASVDGASPRAIRRLAGAVWPSTLRVWLRRRLDRGAQGEDPPWRPRTALDPVH
jgi:hypothetical protein